MEFWENVAAATDGNQVMLLLYVDDVFVTGMDGLIADTKRKLAA